MIEKKTLTNEDILHLDQSYRRDFINRLTGARAAWILGSFHPEHGDNLALFSSIVHIGANPPLLGIIFRPNMGKLHSLRNINESKLFSLNSLPIEFKEKIHSTSANWPENHDDLKNLGLEKEHDQNHPVPLIKNASIQILLEPIEAHKIQINSTDFLVAKIIKIVIHSENLDSGGLPTPENLTHVSGLDLYCRVESLESLPYARAE